MPLTRRALYASVFAVSAMVCQTVAAAQSSSSAPNSGSDALALAKLETISPDEANHRIALMLEAAKLKGFLARKYPDNFSSIKVVETPTDIKFDVAIFGNTLENVSSIVKTAIPAKYLSYFKFVKAGNSAKSRKTFDKNLVKKLQTLGIKATVYHNSENDSIIIETNDDALLHQLMSTGKINIPGNISIRHGSGIILTGTNLDWTGGQYLSADDDTLCTTSFPGRKYNATLQDGSDVGYYSAGHCYTEGGAVNYDGYIDAVNAGAYPAHSNVSASVAQVGTLGNDSQLSYFAYDGGAYNTVEDTINDGNNLEPIVGVVGAYSNELVCKYGKTSGRTCGLVDDSTATDSYGTFYEVDSYFAYPVQSKEGDSGGAVFSEDSKSNIYAVGIVHGRDSKYDMYFSAMSSWNPVDQADSGNTYQIYTKTGWSDIDDLIPF